ncbi:hypothetical protein KUCAC02_016568 [Chaenocephalus aceratus]|nr:hypothetical protein KUCAC02_016568 [Chaenocephalus aceratus]
MSRCRRLKKDAIPNTKGVQEKQGPKTPDAQAASISHRTPTPRLGFQKRADQKKLVHTRAKSIQCELVPLPPLTLLRPFGESTVKEHIVAEETEFPMVMEEESDCDSSDDSDMTGKPDSVDPEWFPPEDIEEEEDDYMEELLPGASPQHQKYVVDEERLLNFFTICRVCCVGGATKFISAKSGTMITVEQYCRFCDTTSSWTSQPGDQEGLIAEGNISLSCAILYAGAVPHKVIRVLNFWGVQTYSKETYFYHQKQYLHGAVRRVWEKQHSVNLSQLHKHSSFAGDATPMGHSAKYGSYSLQDTRIEVYEKHTDILLSKHFMKSVRKLSPDSQTSSLEGYHATIIYFAPKMYHFGYATMISRLQLAALHFNENGGRDQAKGKHGVLQFNIAYPKYKKKDGYSLKRVLTKCTFVRGSVVNDSTRFLFRFTVYGLKDHRAFSLGTRLTFGQRKKKRL